ncbi:MAG: hypothetical protein H7144_07425 [Burkholderiales bacterium]|nr:hypothetical protein [Phycisphaerae bacterium]
MPAANLPLRTQFSDGMIVEFHSVFDGQSSWWTPNGAPMTEGLYDPALQGNQMKTMEFAVLVKGPGAQIWNATNIRWSSTDTPLGFAGVKLASGRAADRFRLICMRPPTQPATTLKLRFALKPEQTPVALKPGFDDVITATVPGLGEVELSNAREIDGQAAVDAIIPKPTEGLQVVVVARPKGGSFIPALDAAIGGTDSKSRTIRYRAKLGDVAEFYVRLRSYDRWVEFRDISQKSAAITSPSVVSSEDEQKTPTTNPSKTANPAIDPK